MLTEWRKKGASKQTTRLNKQGRERRALDGRPGLDFSRVVSLLLSLARVSRRWLWLPCVSLLLSLAPVSRRWLWSPCVIRRGLRGCLPATAEGSIPGSGRSAGGGNGNPLQYSCLENPWTEEPGGLQSIGLQNQTRLTVCAHTHTHTHTHYSTLHNLEVTSL